MEESGSLPELGYPTGASHVIREPPRSSHRLLPASDASAVLARALAEGVEPSPEEHEDDDSSLHGATESPSIGRLSRQWLECRNLATVEVATPGSLASVTTRLLPRLAALPSFRASVAVLPRSHAAALLVAASLFRVRPVWSLHVIHAVLGKRQSQLYGSLLTAFALRVRSGAFRSCLVRHGVDPAADPRCVAYQMCDKAAGPSAASRGSTAAQRRQAVVEALRTVLARHSLDSQEQPEDDVLAASASSSSATAVAGTNTGGDSISEREDHRRALVAAVESVPGALAGAACTVHSDANTAVTVRHRTTSAIVDVACELLRAAPGLHPAACTSAAPRRVSLSALVYGSGQAKDAHGSSLLFPPTADPKTNFTEPELWASIGIGRRRLRALLWTSHESLVHSCRHALAAPSWQGDEQGWMDDVTTGLFNSQLALLLAACRRRFRLETSTGDAALLAATDKDHGDEDDVAAGLVSLPSIPPHDLPRAITPAWIQEKAAAKGRREATPRASAGGGHQKRARPRDDSAPAMRALYSPPSMLPAVSAALGDPATFAASLNVSASRALQRQAARKESSNDDNDDDAASG